MEQQDRNEVLAEAQKIVDSSMKLDETVEQVEAMERKKQKKSEKKQKKIDGLYTEACKARNLDPETLTKSSKKKTKKQEEVIDKDTETLINLEKKNIPLFISHISDIKIPLLMSASKTDEMLNNDLESEFHEIAKNNPLIQYKIWEDGHHPLIATKALETAQMVINFIHQ